MLGNWHINTFGIEMLMKCLPNVVQVT